jgi:NAD(P)-dependent dehydrogenase (short-subunit alcohol dehydrogenase family)
MDTRDLRGTVAAVTGAASGIGRATALEAARRGADVAICDVDEPALAAAADELRKLGVRVCARPADVSRPEAMQAFAAAAHDELGPVRLLVNNAGIGVGGAFLDVPLEEWTRVVGTNLMGVVHGCAAFVPRMVETGRGGHVVNVASMAGYCAGAMMTSYHATKFGVIGFSESLRAELSVHGIGVTAICPGVIDTNITRVSRFYGPAWSEEQRERLVRAFQRRGYHPERVARAILKAVRRNRAVAPVSPEAWAGYYLKRFAPWAVAWFARAPVRRLTRGGAGRPA